MNLKENLKTKNNMEDNQYYAVEQNPYSTSLGDFLSTDGTATIDSTLIFEEIKKKIGINP